MPAVHSRGRTMGRDSAPQARNDAYVGLLLLALLAQVAGGVFLLLDYSQYTSNKPPAVTPFAAAPQAGPPTQPGAGQPNQPGVGQMGGNPPGNPPPQPGLGQMGGNPPPAPPGGFGVNGGQPPK